MFTSDTRNYTKLTTTLFYCFYFLLFFNCKGQPDHPANNVLVGAERMENYLPYLRGKEIALIVNHTSLAGRTHLVDTLLSLDMKISKVFAPEHGFRGTADAGQPINNEKDAASGLPVISLYGKNKKPSASDLQGIDLIVFDIQDVGTRFYTYISTMHYVMEACAENDIPLLILDRPNPNGHYIDGPVLQPDFRSFVGLHPIPVVHGLTVGELATMINKEGWLADSLTCDLTVVEVGNWNHKMPYSVPVKPSPNLPNDRAINLYPSLCFFEGTVMSIGRGTSFPFQVVGHPQVHIGGFQFTPKSIPGALNPKYAEQICYGLDLRESERLNHIELEWLLSSYKNYSGDDFFNPYFEKLAGTAELKKQITEGYTAEEIRASWQEDLKDFQKLRKKYLLYPDF